MPFCLLLNPTLLEPIVMKFGKDIVKMSRMYIGCFIFNIHEKKENDFHREF